MGEVYRDGMLRRPWVMVIGLVVYAIFMAYLATFAAYFVFDPLRGTEEAIEVLLTPYQWFHPEPMWWAFCGGPALLIVVTQALFLWPLRGGEIRTQADGKPMMITLVTAGLVGAVLTLALLFGIGGAAQLIWAINTRQDPAEIPVEDEATPFILLVIGVVLLGSWIVWTILLRRFASRYDPPTRFGRIVGLLFAGTVVETLVVLPVDIMIRRRTDCYCGTGGFYSMCLSTWALLWLCGPGAFLVLTGKKRRRAWARTHCMKCGYERGPLPAPRCPECGNDWSTASASS
jgi:hypothetical protein